MNHPKLPTGVIPHGHGYAAILQHGTRRHYLCYSHHIEEVKDAYDAVKYLVQIGYLQPDNLPPPVSLRGPYRRKGQTTVRQRCRDLGIHPNTAYQRAKKSNRPVEEILTDLENQQTALHPA